MTDWTPLARAAAWAFALHGAQRRKGTDIPYVAHLMAVSALVLEHGGDQDQAVAALLHDAIEDAGATDADIAARFGPRVAAIVRACTDADTQPKPPWRARKEAHIAHLAEAPEEALLVALCDKLHNARALVDDLRREGPGTLARFNGGLDGTLWYHAAMAAAFRRRLGGAPAVAALEEAVAALYRHGGGSAPT